MGRYKQDQTRVGGKTRKLIIGEDLGAIAYFTLSEEEYVLLQRQLQPITFQPCYDVPMAPSGEIRKLLAITPLIAKALKLLYQDENLRRQAVPEFLADLIGEKDAVMSGVGFDFLVGPHLERPVLLEAAAFGPEFVSTAIIAEFFGLRTLKERLATWWFTLVKPCLHGARSLHYVTSFGEFDFTREKEHLVLVPYLQKQGLKVSYGPAENKEAEEAEVLYIRAGLQFPHVWQAASETKIWPRILSGDVKVIPPLGNNFFSSKFWRPFLKNPQELVKRGISLTDANQIAAHLPNVMFLDPNLLGFLRTVISRERRFYFKSVWNYGGYGTRLVYSSKGISEALREIGIGNPIIVEEAIDSGFLPYDPVRNLPDRRVEVRVRVFDHEGVIKTQPPSARVYLPGTSYPMDSLYLGSEIPSDP